MEWAIDYELVINRIVIPEFRKGSGIFLIFEIIYYIMRNEDWFL